MYIPDSRQLFIGWIQAFDIRVLQTEADVEKKFIWPMFQHLGYPDSYRQSKYTLTSNDLDNPAKQLKNAQIYFATDDVVRQNADTSLVIVIYLSPNTHYFPEAINQAKFYSKYLKPLIFIVTNGYEIKAFKYFHYHREESIFDTMIDQLRNSQVAEAFYQELNFKQIKNNRKNLFNDLPWQLVNIEKYLRRHQEFGIYLEKSDFEPCLIKEGDRLVVVKPKVLIECNLPQAFGKGDCLIKFSSIILRGLKIVLNHQQILGYLMTGLHTEAQWGCRRFLQQIDADNFEAYLGQTTVILSELEAADLCLCVDVICQEYKQKIIEFENNLATWDFHLVEMPNARGFHLFSVDLKLWKIMHNFIKRFNYAQGKSEWHLFNQENTSIRISRGIRDHAFILPILGKFSSALSNNQVDILYEVSDVHIASLERSQLNYWHEDIGPRGTWTAKYTKTWLIEKYIPKVIDDYSQQYQVLEFDLTKNILNYQPQNTILKEINVIPDLLPYLRNLEAWLSIYRENIPAASLRQYYQVLTDLVKNSDSATASIDYITKNLQKLDWENSAKANPKNLKNWEIGNLKEALQNLDTQLARINNCQYENSWKANLMTRLFIWIIENCKIHYSQSQLNAAKQALLPLWEQCRFEMRHVYPYR
ncbi:type I restriction enzyme HsdR N-terminal domain-containing protein [Nostoc sp. FACHB-110]|uniref:type I restriction enzyme HsdR N-terminal domain-containing protein n=1 Tax=Nostoc sp. FACHB-110 TaxID=2692834 RepID=UPI001686108D|nr:type I restriction enzyme HsdR N-terminal domain-containing protein [Nostoc sp. FACHB-110]MBD2437952.1 type I restriction enzyme HsdR N-terminal domain-containing protein [Nostoc sp. FACHB-110]